MNFAVPPVACQIVHHCDVSSATCVNYLILPDSSHFPTFIFQRQVFCIPTCIPNRYHAWGPVCFNGRQIGGLTRILPRKIRNSSLGPYTK